MDGKQKITLNQKVLFMMFGAGLIATLLFIFDLIALETAIGSFVGTTIGVVIARIASRTRK